MPFFASAATVCLIICHGAPADHFAAFAKSLSKDVGAVEIYASGPALNKLQERGVAIQVPFSIDKISPEEEDALAEQIAEACCTAKVVITDLGHAFAIKVQKALARQAPDVARLAYYENPEPYVPGGYSAMAAEAMKASQGVLFANSHLAKAPLFQAPDQAIDLSNQKKVGIGYYPTHQAEKIAKRRTEEKPALRQALFQKNGIADQGQKVLVYFGGNNEEYFSKALPAFLSLLEQRMRQSDSTNLVIVFQQHPGAKTKNTDRNIVEGWIGEHSHLPQAPKIIIADSNSDDAQTVADGALYYQTSMGPQFVLAGIPTIQIGHKTYEDVLVRNGLSPSVTRVDQLITAIGNLNQQTTGIPQEVIFEGLGIKQDWLQTLETAIKKSQGVTVEHVKYEDAEKHANSPNCIVYEYPMKNPEMNIGVAEITHRYPDKGYAINHKCSEMGYILKGSGKLVTETEEVNLSTGDVVYIPHGKKYYWEGTMTVVVPATPAWYPQQHETNFSTDE